MVNKHIYDCEYILDILLEKEDDICEELDGTRDLDEAKTLFAQYVAVRNTIEKIKESLILIGVN